MRWDRLFADLEAQAEDDALLERDALVADLEAEQWAGTGWRALLGGTVALQVRGVGRLDGEVELVNEVLVHVATPTTDHIVACDAVTAVLSAERRADGPSAVSSRLGWRQVLRRARADGEEGRFVDVDGVVVREGYVDVVGRDFVRVVPTSGRAVVILFSALAVVSLRR